MTSEHDQSRPPPKDLTVRTSFTVLLAGSSAIWHDHCSSRGVARTVRNGHMSSPVVSGRERVAA